MAISAQYAPWKGLDPFRLRHAGSGIKLASEITPCLSCTVAPEPELLGWWTFGSFLALRFASELGLLPAPDCLALPRLLGCWPRGEHPSGSWRLSIGGGIELLARSSSRRFVELVWLEALGFHFASKKDAFSQSSCHLLFAV